MISCGCHAPRHLDGASSDPHEVGGRDGVILTPPVDEEGLVWEQKQGPSSTYHSWQLAAECARGEKTRGETCVS